MADASSNLTFIGSNMDKSPSSSKPTDLDDQRADISRPDRVGETDPTVNHEDDTPVHSQQQQQQQGGGDLEGGDTTTGDLKEGGSTANNVSASDITMSSSRVVNPPPASDKTIPIREELVEHSSEEPEVEPEVKKKPSATLTGAGANGSISNLHDSDSGVSMTASSHTKPKVSHDWIDVLGNRNLLKKVLRDGEGLSTRPTAQSRVRMKVRGSLPSGNTVDRHSALEFTVGDGDVIQALDIIAPLMEKGETCQIKTDHKYAYGAVGRSPDVPPNSNLIYDLELLEVKEPLDFSTITLQELLLQLNKKRGRGNDLFQRKEYSLAVHSYSRAVSIITKYKEEQSVDELPQDIMDLWVRCLNNLAAAQLKVEMYNEALDSVNMVLKAEPNNVKALYRCGKVYMVKQDYEQAVEYLQKASNLDPEEKAINGELQKALRKRDQSREQEKALYKRMITGSPSKGSGSGQTVSKGKAKPSSSWGWRHLLLGASIVAVTAIGIGFMKYRK